MTIAEVTKFEKEDLKWMGIGACRRVLEQEYVEGGLCYTALTPDGYNYLGY